MPRIARLLCALPLAVAAPAVAHASARPSDAGAPKGAITYAVPEATPYDTEHFRVHYVADPASADAPDLTDVAGATGADGSPLPDGVPDVIPAVGAELEAAYAFEVGTLGFTAPPADNADGVQRGGDGRYDVYLVDFDAHRMRGVMGLTVPDPARSQTTFLEIDDDFAPEELAPSTTSGDDERRVTIAHELFHAIQAAYGPDFDGLPQWLAEGTAVWMESQAYPDIHDNAAYLPTLVGRNSEVPLWQPGGLHVYGTWWFVEQLARTHPSGPAVVRRLLETFAAERAAGRDPARDGGLAALTRAAGGRGALAALFHDYAVAGWTRWFGGLLDAHTGRLRGTTPLVFAPMQLSPLQARYYRVRLAGRRVTLVVSSSVPDAIRPADLSVVLGSGDAAAVPVARRIDAYTVEVAAVVPRGQRRQAVLVLSRTAAADVTFQVRALSA